MVFGVITTRVRSMRFSPPPIINFQGKRRKQLFLFCWKQRRNKESICRVLVGEVEFGTKNVYNVSYRKQIHRIHTSKECYETIHNRTINVPNSHTCATRLIFPISRFPKLWPPIRHEQGSLSIHSPFWNAKKWIRSNSNNSFLSLSLCK